MAVQLYTLENLSDEYVPQHRPAPRVVDAAKTKKQAEKVEQFANFSQLKVHAYRGDVNGATDFLKNIEQALLTLCGYPRVWNAVITDSDMIEGYDTPGLSKQLDGSCLHCPFLASTTA